MEENEIRVGRYAFEGGKFSLDPNAYPNCQGVVAWLNPKSSAPIGQRGLILTPDEVRLEWSDKYIDVGIGYEDDGQANTYKLVTCGKRYGIKFPAAEWCHSYSKNGVIPGEGFLPAKNQLKSIVINQNIINLALEKIGGTILRGWIWSSTDHLSNGAWGMSVYIGRLAWDYKNRNCCVRCVVAF